MEVILRLAAAGRVIASNRFGMRSNLSLLPPVSFQRPQGEAFLT